MLTAMKSLISAFVAAPASRRRNHGRYANSSSVECLESRLMLTVDWSGYIGENGKFGDENSWTFGVPDNTADDKFEAAFDASSGETVTIEHPNGQPYNPTSEKLTVGSQIVIDLKGQVYTIVDIAKVYYGMEIFEAEDARLTLTGTGASRLQVNNELSIGLKGTVNVNGPILNGKKIVVQSDGILSTNNGKITSEWLQVGDGDLNVSGSSGTVIVVDGQGLLQLGVQGTGNLSINDGYVNAKILHVGSVGSGFLDVSGEGSIVKVNELLIIGADGNAINNSVEVSSEAQINTKSLIVGGKRLGQIQVRDDGSGLSTSNLTVIGDQQDAGSSNVWIASGAYWVAGDILIGRFAPNSYLEIDGGQVDALDISIGLMGHQSKLEVINGGHLDAEDVTVGGVGIVSSTMRVVGAGAGAPLEMVKVNNLILGTPGGVPGAGRGILNIHEGAIVDVTTNLTVGTDALPGAGLVNAHELNLFNTTALSFKLENMGKRFLWIWATWRYPRMPIFVT